MSNLEPPKSTGFDRAYVLVRAAIGFIPLFGQALEKLFVEHYPGPKARKTAEWQRLMSEQVGALVDGKVVVAFVKFSPAGNFTIAGSSHVSSIMEDAGHDLFQVNLTASFNPDFLVVHPVGACPAFTVLAVGETYVQIRLSDPEEMYTLRIDGLPAVG